MIKLLLVYLMRLDSNLLGRGRDVAWVLIQVLLPTSLTVHRKLTVSRRWNKQSKSRSTREGLIRDFIDLIYFNRSRGIDRTCTRSPGFHRFAPVSTKLDKSTEFISLQPPLGNGNKRAWKSDGNNIKYQTSEQVSSDALNFSGLYPSALYMNNSALATTKRYLRLLPEDELRS